MTSVIAHSGASRRAPENTLEAFALAAVLGADLVELDVRPTVDGHLVVHHDAHLPDGRAIADTPVAEIPSHLPSLAAALDACRPLRGVNVEIKHLPGEPGFEEDRRLGDRVVAELRRLGQCHRVVVSAFDPGVVARVRNVAPEIAVALLVVEPPRDVVERLRELDAQALHPHHQFVTLDLIESCHRAGLAVNCWTLDLPERMEELAGWGIDGICTNVPDVARAVLGPPPS